MPVKPSEKEEEYFLREEFEKRRKAEEAKAAQLKEEELHKLKELHYMHCPKCGYKLIEMNYNKIAVDKCSNCEGVWLDAGELEQVAQLEKNNFNKWFTVFRK